MNEPIQINPRVISLFDSHRFTLLCNDLLRAEADRLAIPQYLVDTTVMDTVPDGGIDCRVKRQNLITGHSDRWLPNGISAWQLKSGKCPSAKELENTELLKPEVTAAINRGEVYCFITAESITAKKKNQIRSAIEKRYKILNQVPNFQVITATDLAYWAKEHLAIGRKYFNIPVEGWFLFDQWEQVPRLANPYFPDEARTEIIEAIRVGIREEKRILRVTGYAGVGKTRAILEALREPGIQNRVLYLPDASRLDSDFFWYLQQENINGSGILVLDECTSDLYLMIRDRLNILPSGFIIITIGPLEYQTRSQTDTLVMNPLKIDELAQILETFIPGLSNNERQAIAIRCGGSPKLAVLLGEIIGKDKEQKREWRHFEEDINIIEYLNHRIFPFDSKDPESRLMRGLCLFSRVGWWDEMAQEGQKVAEFVGLDWRNAREAADRLVQRGVVSPRGRFLYPTPDVLANYLSRETIRIREVEELKILFRSLSNGSQSAFVERLRQLGETPETRKVVTQVLGETGFFRSLTDLNDPSIAHLLRLLSPVYPKEILYRLDQVIGVASHEELLRFDVGRRDIIWALEELAWWPEYFLNAARILLRLAWGENENIGNNATGIWRQLFQVVLGGTSTSYQERLPILHETLNSNDPIMRRLGVLGLGATLQTQHIMRIGNPPEDTGRLPPQEWKPATYKEWAEIIRLGLTFLDHMLEDPDAEVRNKAIEVLEECTQGLMDAGFLNDWLPLSHKLIGQPPRIKKGILNVISWSLRHGEKLDHAEEKTLRELEQLLTGASYSDQLYRVVGSWEYELREINLNQAENPFQILAAKALLSPKILKPELDWLLSGEANLAYKFGRVLGQLDTQEELLDMIIRSWHSRIPDSSFVSGYLAGVVEWRGIDWLEDRLDEWTNDPEKGLLIADIIWRVVSTDRSAHRLQKLIEDNLVPASFLRNLSLGFWARGVSAEVLLDLIKTASKDNSPVAISGRLSILDQYIEEYPDKMSILQPLIHRAIEEGCGLKTTAMDSFHWGRLAERILKDEPVHIASLCIKVIAGKDYQRPNNEIRNVLRQAIEIGGWQIFEKVVGPAIVENPVLLWRLDSPLGNRDLLQRVDPEKLVTWIEEDVETRLLPIARAVPVDGQNLNVLARTLLIRWGDRSEVRSELAATFGTGIHWGPESNWLIQKLKQIEDWQKDPEPNVRAWAAELVDHYQRRLERVKLLEEEER